MTSTGTLTISTPSGCEVQTMRAFDAPRRLVFQALTTPSLLMKWMHGPNGWRLVVCEVDLRPGGTFRYVWRRANGREIGVRGTYRDVVVPERTVHTELFDEDWTGGETVVTSALTERGATTTLTVTIRFASKAARDAAMQTGFTSGMEAGYDALAGVFAAGVRASS